MMILAYASTGSVIRPEDAKKLTHLHLAFGLLQADGQIETNQLELLNALPDIRRFNPNIKIILSVVGKTPDAFTRCAADPALHKAVGRSCAHLVNHLHLDGIDLDWEYPCVPSNGVDTVPQDKYRFTRLLRAVRQALDENCQEQRPLLSIAAGADLFYVNNVELPRLAEILDYVCLMTYDLKGGPHTITGHHTGLFTACGDFYCNSCDQALRLFEANGMPKEKLLLGAATYSRKWTQVPNRNHGFLQMTPMGADYGPGYGELKESYVNKNGFTRHWDNQAKAPYLFDGSTFYTYDDEESVMHKCRYVHSAGYAGIFYWEHQSDPDAHLLTVMAEAQSDKPTE